MRNIVWFVALCLLGTSLAYAQDAPLKVAKDTVRIVNAELVIENSTKQAAGFLYNNKNGRTTFAKIARMVQFKVGAAGFPPSGETSYTDTAFKNKHIRVWRNGLLQYKDYLQGITVDQTAGTITFYPALADNDRIYIEAVAGVESNEEQTAGDGTPSLKRLYAGVVNNGDNTFTLRWATNHTTLYNAPRVAGIGSSTLAGYGLDYPNRLGDRISAWLAGSTLSPSWANYGVAGYRSIDVQKASEGGVTGHNIEAAYSFNPDIILVILPTNDAGSGITPVQTMINLRKLDTMSQNRGIPLFFETAQPRTSYGVNEQAVLKIVADSIRNAWPDRYIEGFIGFTDPNSGTPAAILPSYDNGDQTHLNPEGIQHLARNIFDRLTTYFQPIIGVSKYTIDTSSNGISWAQYDVISNGNIVKKRYTAPHKRTLYFRISAQLVNSTTLTSNTVVMLPPDNGGPSGFDHRVLIDLGGDGANTINGSNRADGKPTPSPDLNGNYWNNWYGKGGITGFVDKANSGTLNTTANRATPLSVELIGNPEGTFGSSSTHAINYNGFNTGTGDYPMEALYDNMYMHSSINPNGVTLRVRGLNRANTYSFKLWGARIDANTTQRMLETKLGSELWADAKRTETRYPEGSTPDYNNANVHANVTGVDSIDINLRVGNGSTIAHVSLIDIGIKGTLPAAPYVDVRDTSIALPKDTVQITPLIQDNGIAISGYQWEQLSGPNTALITNPYGATTSIKQLTNGVFTFRFKAITAAGLAVSDILKVSVFPDNNGRKTLRVNFSLTQLPEVPGWMNIFGRPSGNHISMKDPVTNWLVDNISGATNYWTEYSGASSSDIDGQSTGNNTGVVPDAVLKSYWFNYSTRYSTVHNLLVGGLTSGKTYTIQMVASRSNSNGATAPRYGVYRINGGTELFQDAWQNTSNITTTTAIADAEGRIYIDVYPTGNASYGSFSYINALIIQEN
ncbi:SGNH/GDSL hydrolase family protein [Chitinophaga filiformis]|uniref:SGNH/GDSL hydrolase family protein n=1 Tax=Chitinophaga filiformis TaxID=104663 RepID=UPI001F2F15DA|nr:SGNH/GDSL hydrolase family protein [Chitinophaga filiformis]MCF6406423.1 SGNH/GDSL hydrolase family protein [Chitinophaga filiformis]